jgi:hypothetical protein
MDGWIILPFMILLSDQRAAESGVPTHASTFQPDPSLHYSGHWL